MAEKAGIKKRVYNPLFRHSRSTELAQHLTESQLEEHLGWVPGSEMPGVYVHLTGKKIDDALLRICGIKNGYVFRIIIMPIYVKWISYNK